MQFLVNWLEGASNAALEERATVGHLRILIDFQNVTMHLFKDKTEDGVHISLYGLAEGLSHDWWILFGGRDAEISLLDYRGGYIVPDVRLSFDGALLEVSARQKIYQNPNIRFWSGITELLERTSAEIILSEFIDSVITRMESKGIEATSAQLRWARIKESRLDPDEAMFCEAAGSLGLDPYQIEESYADLIEKAGELFDSEALLELLAGSKEFDQVRLLEWIVHAEHRPKRFSRLSNLIHLRDQAVSQAPNRALEPSWALGYRRARVMRKVMDLKSTDKFRSFRDVGKGLGASSDFKIGANVNGLRALRVEEHKEAHIHLRHHGDFAEARSLHLFSFVRAIGDAVCFPQSKRSPVNDLHSAYRQSAGRAFAAEFLAPIEEISAMKEDGLDNVSIADEFGVSTEVVIRQIENKERISKACSLRPD
jgi:hypothetical protein